MRAHPIEQVLAALNAAEVRYLVVGGVAVVLHRADADALEAIDRKERT